jgi:hypothetical protein
MSIQELAEKRDDYLLNFRKKGLNNTKNFHAAVLKNPLFKKSQKGKLRGVSKAKFEYLHILSMIERRISDEHTMRSLGASIKRDYKRVTKDLFYELSSYATKLIDRFDLYEDEVKLTRVYKDLIKIEVKDEVYYLSHSYFLEASEYQFPISRGKRSNYEEFLIDPF